MCAPPPPRPEFLEQVSGHKTLAWDTYNCRVVQLLEYVMLVRKVDKQVALNPVARAVALGRLRAAVTDVLVRLYLFPDGTNVHTQIMDANELLSIVMRCVELYGDVSGVDYRVMRGAHSCMIQLSESGFIWYGRHAPAIDVGLRRALEMQPEFTPLQIKTAWQELMTVAAAVALQKSVD